MMLLFYSRCFIYTHRTMAFSVLSLKKNMCVALCIHEANWVNKYCRIWNNTVCLFILFFFCFLNSFLFRSFFYFSNIEAILVKYYKDLGLFLNLRSFSAYLVGIVTMSNLIANHENFILYNISSLSSSSSLTVTTTKIKIVSP